MEDAHSFPQKRSLGIPKPDDNVHTPLWVLSGVVGYNADSFWAPWQMFPGNCKVEYKAMKMTLPTKSV